MEDVRIRAKADPDHANVKLLSLYFLGLNFNATLCTQRTRFARDFRCRSPRASHQGRTAIQAKDQRRLNPGSGIQSTVPRTKLSPRQDVSAHRSTMINSSQPERCSVNWKYRDKSNLLAHTVRADFGARDKMRNRNLALREKRSGVWRLSMSSEINQGWLL